MNEQAPAPSSQPPEQAALAGPATLTGRAVLGRRLAATGGTLLAAGAGGALARLVGIPLPWLLGPLFATAFVALVGVPIAPIRYGRTVGQVVIGGAIGVQFTKTILINLVSLLPVMVATALLSMVVGACGALMLKRLGRLDTTTAFFCTVPGGVAEMMNLAPRYGAQLEPIMVAQTLRVGLIVALAPFLVIQFSHADITAVPSGSIMELPIAAMLLAACVVGGALFAYSTFPNAWFLGSIAVGILFATFGFAEGRMPGLILIPAQILIGASLGVQFRREFLTRLLRLLLASSVIVVYLAVSMALIGAGVALALTMPVPTLVLAMAPAGMAEMVLTAKLLGLDGTVVAGFQLVRIIVILFLCRPAYWLFTKVVA
jgi:membrane AbrB-like protein